VLAPNVLNWTDRAPSFRNPRIMNSNRELLQLERALHEARNRLALVTRFVPDATARRAAEDLYAEAIAAVDVHMTAAALQKN